ncbi:hypothetical protein D3C72_2404460 [compost metagenome]
MILAFEPCDLKYCALPVIVPPEPIPATKASIWPSICSKISGPVVLKWAAVLASLANWLTK